MGLKSLGLKSVLTSPSPRLPISRHLEYIFTTARPRVPGSVSVTEVVVEDVEIDAGETGITTVIMTTGINIMIVDHHLTMKEAMIVTTTVHRDTVMIGIMTITVILAIGIVTGITRTGTGRIDTEMRDTARTGTGSRTDMNVLHETTTSGTVDTTDMRGTDITTRVVPAGGHLLLDLLLTEDLTTEVMDDGLKRQC